MSATSVEQRTTWKLDTNNTSVEFSVKKFMVTNVKGRFAAFTGTITADQANPELSTVNVSIEVASVDTRDEKRDAHLKSADFFDVETFPALTFESTRVERVGEEQFRVIGNLTIRDTTREVALDTTFHGIGDTPWNTQVAAFTAETTVNRRDYGLVWNMPLEKGGVLVGDNIKISLEVQATKQQA